MAKSLYQAKMEETGLLMKSKLTHEDYTNELLAFQKMLGNIVFDDGEVHRADEIIVELERTARKEQLEKNPQFRNGIAALQQIQKEISICMAGKLGEERVVSTLEYITRPCYKYRNIYITDGERETELDNLILTENGLIILEVKNVKTDITINENGRILYDNLCYHDISICDKMQEKRDLLRAELEKRLDEKSLSVPIVIDSYLVLSTRKGTRIRVNDQCRKEKYCFRTQLPYIIDDYNNAVSLSGEELQVLDTVISEIETQKKCFDSKLDFNQIRADIAGALDVCMHETTTVVEEKEQTTTKQKSEEAPIISLKEYRHKRARKILFNALTSTALSIGSIIALINRHMEFSQNVE